MKKQLHVKELAAKITHKDKYPVAIIGAGLGGLMAGACLAKNGFPVTLYEKYHKLGGYATQFKRNRFDFDVSLSRTIAHGPMESLLDEAGVRNPVRFISWISNRGVTPTPSVHPSMTPVCWMRFPRRKFLQGFQIPVRIIGIEPGDISPQIGLSTPIKKQFKKLAAIVLCEATGLAK